MVRLFLLRNNYNQRKQIQYANPFTSGMQNERKRCRRRGYHDSTRISQQNSPKKNTKQNNKRKTEGSAKKTTRNASVTQFLVEFFRKRKKKKERGEGGEVERSYPLSFCYGCLCGAGMFDFVFVWAFFFNLVH